MFSTGHCRTVDTWTVCPETDGIRIVRIFSPDRGTLSVTNSLGVPYAVPSRTLERFMGYNSYFPHCVGSNGIYGPQSGCTHRVWPSGYTFLVKANDHLTMTVPQHDGVEMDDTFVMEYSEPQMDNTEFTLTIVGTGKLSGECTIQNTHSRSYMTAYGPLIPAAGVWFSCTEGWTTNSDIEDFKNALPAIMSMGSGGATPDCSTDCDDMTFTDFTHVGDPVCGTEMCSDGAPYVNAGTFGCSAQPFVGNCCDSRTCDTDDSGNNSNSECSTCTGLTFSDGAHDGQNVCDANLCGDPFPYVNTATFGCSSDPFDQNCCDKKTLWRTDR
eukprot:UN24543